MSGTVRLAMIATLGCGLMSATGCSRTSDGTVVMPSAPPIASYMPSWRPWWRRSEEPQPVASQQSFPVAAEPAEARSNRAPRVSKPKGFAVRARGNMECVNRTQPGGRVKVVCG